MSLCIFVHGDVQLFENDDRQNLLYFDNHCHGAYLFMVMCNYLKNNDRQNLLYFELDDL